jgi:MFS family permease
VSFLEPIGVVQVITLLPVNLPLLGLPPADVPVWVGRLTPLMFLVGLPLVPFWGAWADTWSRKAVIVRSALVEAIVLAAVAASREPWQLGASLMGMGLSLGNTGVMLAIIRETAPRERLGTVLSSIGAAGFLGAAVGPALAGLIVDGLGLPLANVFIVSSALMFAVCALLVLFMPESHPAEPVTASPFRIALDSIRGAFVDGPTRGLFTLFGLAFLASMMTSAYVPLLVERVNGPEGLVSAIAVVAGAAALIGGVLSPIAGVIGDRLGFRTVLAASLVLGGGALIALPTLPTVLTLAAVAAVFSLSNAASRAMIFGLLSIEIAPERRGTTLNLVYLPLYVAGIVGPTLSSIVVGAGVDAPFRLAGAVLLAGGLRVGVPLARRAVTG